MFWRGVLLMVVAVTLTGCVTERNGLDYVAMTQKFGVPKAGQARIVVLREKGYAGITDEGWELMLDGAPLRELKTGTYIYTDRPAGHHKLSATMHLFNGVSERDIAAESGHSYFLLARPSDRSKTLAAMSNAGGLAGLVIGAAVTSNNANQGPLDFFLLDDAGARDAMTDLQLAD